MNGLLSRPFARLQLAVFGSVAAVGALGFGAFGHPGGRAAGSFLGGMALAQAAFSFGTFNIRLADRFAPQLSMAVALFSYATTAVAMGLVLAISSPRVVHPAGMAVGLMTGVVLWVGFELARTITRPEARSAHP